MTTLECMVRGFGAVVPTGAEKVGTDAGAGVALDWKEQAAAARVREKLERRVREEKRGKVLENRMVVADGEGEWEEVDGARELYRLGFELDVNRCIERMLKGSWIGECDVEDSIAVRFVNE